MNTGQEDHCEQKKYEKAKERREGEIMEDFSRGLLFLLIFFVIRFHVWFYLTESREVALENGAYTPIFSSDKKKEKRINK